MAIADQLVKVVGYHHLHAGVEGVQDFSYHPANNYTHEYRTVFGRETLHRLFQHCHDVLLEPSQVSRQFVIRQRRVVQGLSELSAKLTAAERRPDVAEKVRSTPESDSFSASAKL